MKKIIKYILCLLFLFGSIYLIHDYYTEVDLKSENVSNELINNEENIDIITNLKTKYNNNDIVLLLEIPGVLSVPVVQSSDNSFYLTHDLYKRNKSSGSVFLDYRNVSFSDRKLIVYGHNSVKTTLPFTNLLEYESYDFYKEHPSINIYTTEGVKKYNIFSSYVETDDFDYVNLNTFNGLSYYDHLLKLKNKSKYDTGTEIKENSKIIILQTCTFSDEYNSYTKYQLVMGVLDTESN